MTKKLDIPKEVSCVTQDLEKAGFEAYLVGGCVRDLLIGKKPKDWDVTTNAKPEQIQEIFAKTVYENSFGTVAVINEKEEMDLSAEALAEEDETLKVIEITPYRLESKYSDKRHPDEVSFTSNIEDDLKRRDFTINALALKDGEVLDLYNGQKDLKDKIIKAVGKPDDRFKEDALRMLRAIRLAVELGFEIEKGTLSAIKKHAKLISDISKERIRDEFVKMIMSDRPAEGMELLKDTGLLDYIIPEFANGYKMEQNKSHIFTVWVHSIRALEHSAKKGFPLDIRLSALFHDIGKPFTMYFDYKKKERTFYNHEVVGGRITAQIMANLKFPKKLSEKVTKLVRYHLFFSDTDVITLSAVRRIVRNVGPENVWDLMNVRFCDRVGMGRPKESPYRLRKYESMIDEAMRAPISVGMLKMDGAKLMKLLKVEPGPKIGFILHILLEEVLDDPLLNTEDYMEKRARELGKMTDKELEAIGKKAKERKEEEEEKEISQIRKKWFVK